MSKKSAHHSCVHRHINTIVIIFIIIILYLQVIFIMFSVFIILTFRRRRQSSTTRKARGRGEGGEHHHPQDGLELESGTIQVQRRPKRGTSWKKRSTPNLANWARPGPRFCGCFVNLRSCFSQEKITDKVGRGKQHHSKQGGWDSSAAKNERWRPKRRRANHFSPSPFFVTLCHPLSPFFHLFFHPFHLFLDFF